MTAEDITNKTSFGPLVVRKLIACQPVNGHIGRLISPWKEMAEAIESCPLSPQERTSAFEAAIADLQDRNHIREQVFAADLGIDLAGFENAEPILSSNSDTPPLPSSVQLPESLGDGACDWLDEYIQFSRKWAPRAYDGFHEAIGVWLLSTIGARRLYVDMGKQRFTNLYIALIARTSFFTKTTATEIAIQTIEQAGLRWLIAPDNATPQKFIENMSTQTISDFDQLTDEQKSFAMLSAAFAGQRGWYYEEFGQHIAAMMREGGIMADFRGLIRRLDDTPERYEYSTIGRGRNVIERPYLSLLANLTPADLQPFARRGSALWGDGFLARFALAYPDTEERKKGRFPDGHRIIPASLLQPLQLWHQRLGVPEIKVVDQLGKDGKLTGIKKVVFKPVVPNVLAIAPDVVESYYRYHDALGDLASNSENHDLDGNYSRMAEKALRIASLLAGVNGANGIELAHWARAQAITERWRGGLHELYRQLNEAGYSEERNIEDRLLSVIQRKGPSTKRELRNNTKLSTREIERALSNLEETGFVEKTVGQRTTRYSLTEESEEV